MPDGSKALIFSRLELHGSTAEKTCCSRIRRAMSCVYWPPKSRTTMPPRSELGRVVRGCRAGVVDIPWASICDRISGGRSKDRRLQNPLHGSLHHQVHQFVWDEDDFLDLLAGQVRGDAWVGFGLRYYFVFGCAGWDFHFPTHAPTHLDHDFYFVFASEVFAELRPGLCREAFGVAQEFPQ